MIRLSFSIGLLSLLFTSCASIEVADSKDVNQETIYQGLSVNINAETGNHKASAVFRFGGALGTTLRLSEGSNITLNEKEMSGGNKFARGYRYETNVEEKDDLRYKFTFTDINKKTYENSVFINPIALPEEGIVIDNTSKNKINWIGLPVGAHEKVTIIIKHGDNLSKRDIFSIDNKSAKKIKLKKESLTRLYPGDATIQIVRNIRKELKNATKDGGVILGKYSSKVIPIKITGEMPVDHYEEDKEPEQESASAH